MGLWQTITRLLFDKSAARKDMIETDSILREVLGTYSPQENFTDALNRVFEQREKGSSFHRTPFFKRFLFRYRRREDYSADLFTIARHILEDLPKIYGIKREDLGEQ